MKIVRTLSVFLIVLTTNIAFAQTANITGKTSTENKSPLSFVTVSLLKKSDSSLVKVAVSNEAGSFTMDNITSGNYLLKFTNVGFEQMFFTIDSLQFNSNLISCHFSFQLLCEQGCSFRFSLQPATLIRNLVQTNFQNWGDGPGCGSPPRIITENDP